MSKSASGQVVIITAAAMIVLLGVCALVADLGMSWMLRRQEQNAADPAAIAAARHLRDAMGNAAWNQGLAETDACFYAQENGFFAGDAGCAGALAADKLQVHSPPISGPFSGFRGRVQVVIREEHPSFFGRIFGATTASVITDAVAANESNNSNSSSLVALQPDCSGGSAGDVDGGGEVRIFPTVPGAVGGYVHVNSTCGGSRDDVCQNGSGSAALSISGTLRAPYVYTTGTCTTPGGGGLQCDPPPATGGCIDEGAVPLGDPLAGVPEPVLSDFPNGRCPDGTISTATSTRGCDLSRSAGCPVDPADSRVDICTLTPGVYYGGWTVGNRVRLFLEPGMYILAGGGISPPSGGSIEAVTNAAGVEARIMIFSTDGPGCPSIGAQCQGTVRMTSRDVFKAKALNSATCAAVSPQACPWKGILLWQDGSASNATAAVHLGGQASSVMAGTIYAPRAQVEVSGGATGTGCGGSTAASCLAIQIIAYRFKVSGGGLVEMPYDPAELYQLPQRGLVD
jgi:hypothetical protein